MKTQTFVVAVTLAFCARTPICWAGSTLFVNGTAAAGGNGQSWATAYQYIQDALTTAQNSGGTVTEIWVARGIYRPDKGLGHQADTIWMGMQQSVHIPPVCIWNDTVTSFPAPPLAFGVHRTSASG